MSKEKEIDAAIDEVTKLGEYLEPKEPAELAPVVPKSPAAMVPVTQGGIKIQSLEELTRFAKMIVAEGAAPKGMTPGQAAVAIQAGLERGLGLLGGLTQGVVINGVFSWRGQGAVALIQNSGTCKPGTLRFWTEGEGDERQGVAIAHRVGYQETHRAVFSVKDAKRAGLWGKSGPWSQYPDRQLAWRALGHLARDVFPDVLGGFPLAEEAVDLEELPEQKPTTPPPLGAPTTPAEPDPLLDAIGGKPAPEVDDETWDKVEREDAYRAVYGGAVLDGRETHEEEEPGK